MTRHFLHELENLKRSVMAMGGLVETAVARAMRAFLEKDLHVARDVLEGDDEVNEFEITIEEEVLKLMALYAPTARDLRFLAGVFKIVNDLERVGDLAVNLAERALDRRSNDVRPGIRQLDEMSDHVRNMLRRSLDAFLSQNVQAAREVLEMDDRADEFLRQVYEGQVGSMQQGATEFEAAMRILASAKYMERIADHATNVAEDVVYMATGEVVKHRF